jgi:hypothetical protein
VSNIISPRNPWLPPGVWATRGELEIFFLQVLLSKYVGVTASVKAIPLLLPEPIPWAREHPFQLLMMVADQGLMLRWVRNLNNYGTPEAEMATALTRAAELDMVRADKQQIRQFLDSLPIFQKASTFWAAFFWDRSYGEARMAQLGRPRNRLA